MICTASRYTDEDLNPKPIAWLMIAPSTGVHIFIEDEAEAERFMNMDARSITPLYDTRPKHVGVVKIMERNKIVGHEHHSAEAEYTCCGFYSPCRGVCAIENKG
jgi:hypothetical protein